MKKTLVAIGDSITKGTYTAPTDPSPNTVAEKPFAKLVADALGYDEFINCGMNGTSVSRLAKVFPEHAMSVRIDKTPDADLLIVAAGTNDYAGGIPLGSFEDTEDISFCGGLDVFFSKIAKRYKRVAVITPIPRRDDGENVTGATLADYSRAIEHFAKKYGFFLVDGSLVPIDAKSEEGRRLCMLDGLHPNPYGHELYAGTVISAISASDFLK